MVKTILCRPKPEPKKNKKRKQEKKIELNKMCNKITTTVATHKHTLPLCTKVQTRKSTSFWWNNQPFQCHIIVLKIWAAVNPAFYLILLNNRKSLAKVFCSFTSKHTICSKGHKIFCCLPTSSLTCLKLWACSTCDSQRRSRNIQNSFMGCHDYFIHLLQVYVCVYVHVCMCVYIRTQV